MAVSSYNERSADSTHVNHQALTINSTFTGRFDNTGAQTDYDYFEIDLTGVSGSLTIRFSDPNAYFYRMRFTVQEYSDLHNTAYFPQTNQGTIFNHDPTPGTFQVNPSGTMTLNLSSLNLGRFAHPAIEFEILGSSNPVYSPLDYVITIGTGGGGDNTAPTLSSSTPTDNASGVSPTANIVLNFNEAVRAGSGTVSIYRSDGTLIESISITDTTRVTFSGSTVTINPNATLAANTGFYVNMSAGAVQDTAGNGFAGISGTTQFNFTTAAAADTTAPTLSSSSPADNATGVAVGANIVLTFNEAVRAGTGTIEIHKTSDNSLVTSISVLDINQASFSGSTLTINPASDLAAGTGYYITLGSGVVRDTAGNAFAGISGTTQLNFTTAGADPATGLRDEDAPKLVNNAQSIAGVHRLYQSSDYHFDPVTRLWSVIKDGATVFQSFTQSGAQSLYDYLADDVAETVEEFAEEYAVDHIPGGRIAFDAWKITQPALGFKASTQQLFDKIWTRLDQAFIDADPTNPNMNATFDAGSVEDDLRQYVKDNIDRIIGYPVNASLDAAENIVNSIRGWFQHSDIGVRIDIDIRDTGRAVLNANPGHNNFASGSGGADEFNGGESGDILWGAGGNDILRGYGGHDILIGGDGDDSVSGMDGNDLLLGGNGVDTLNGGLGSDVFVVAGDGQDTIQDFRHSEGDRIDLRQIDGIQTFADVQARMSESLGTTTINLGTTSVVLSGISRASLVEGDFILNPVSSRAEISVLGNGVSIQDDDYAPTTQDDTDFGTVNFGAAGIVHTFTVTNTGTATLSTSGLTLPTGFTLVDGLSSSIAPGASDTFQVRLDTAAAGIKSGQITFTTNDLNETHYSFAVTGRVIVPGDDFADSQIDTSSPVGQLVSNTQASGLIETGGDHDWFRIDLLAGQTYTFRLQGEDSGAGRTLNDPYLRLYSSAGKLLAFNDDANSSTYDSQITYTVKTAGAYYLDAASFSSNETGSYTVLASGPLTHTGGTGADIFTATATAELFFGQAGADTVSYANANAAVVVSLKSTKANTGFAAGDAYNSIENLRGSGFADTLTGDTGNNVIEGGAGADRMDGGSGIDTASYANAAAGVHADLLYPSDNTGEALGDTYRAIENLLGSAFDDFLAGDRRANAIDGGAGNDTLYGDAGADIMTGGTGADSFNFGWAKEGGDTITDFVTGIDAIGIYRAGFGIVSTLQASAPEFAANYFVTGAGLPNSFVPSGVAPTQTGHGQFLFNTATEKLWWDLDGAGKGKAILLATFSTNVDLHATDFDLY